MITFKVGERDAFICQILAHRREIISHSGQIHIYTVAEGKVIQYANRKQLTVIRELTVSTCLFSQWHI